MNTTRSPAGFDLSRAVHYHYGKFPPTIENYGSLIKPLARASAALARYDQMPIAEPYFYISAYFEAHKDEYINRLRAVAAADGWGEWIGLFLAATAGQARLNLDKAEQS